MDVKEEKNIVIKKEETQQTTHFPIRSYLLLKCISTYVTGYVVNRPVSSTGHDSGKCLGKRQVVPFVLG